MAVSRGEETALGSARGRFLESLPRKAIELRGAIAQLSAEPAAEGPRNEMRRKMQALYASALVFRNDVLAALIQEGVTRLDAVTEVGRALGTEDLNALSELVKRIADARLDERATNAAGPVSDVAPVPAAGRRRSNTLTGLVPVGAPPSVPSEMPGRWVARPVTRSSAPHGPVLQRVLDVLVVAREAQVAELCRLLADEGMRATAASSASAALESLRQDAPDVILAEAELTGDGTLVAGLRGNPLTDFVPLVLIAASESSSGLCPTRGEAVDEIISRPLRPELLVRVLGRVTGTLVEPEAPLAGLREATLEDVAARLGEEIRRGLVDAAESGAELKVELGEGAEVMAAAWAAVARVRALFSERSGGRVRFADRALRAAPGLLSLGAPGEPAPLAGDTTLAGRRILVADDDSAVLLFFASLLREAGAYVTEASDGAEALRVARRERPDLVISDLVMPGLDGFALCRELKRDPLLADVPVILISWKDDLLARMRELSSGADGYLRKEAGAEQILASVREVFAPHSRLEASLGAPGEVRGNLEGTGVVALLRSVRRARPDARITVRDAWNLFECELRDGRLAQLTRTAADGSFVRNEGALPQLLGVGGGRFTVSAAQGPLKHAFEGTLDEALARGARELGAMLDAVSGPLLSRVECLVFDEDAHAALLDRAPPLLREVVQCLSHGERPENLWQRGLLPRELLESMLLDLAKRGAIRAVIGTRREDLLAVARAQRARLPPTALSSPHSMLPPAPAPLISVLPSDGSELPPRRAWPDEDPPTGEIVVASMLPPPPAAPGSVEPDVEPEAPPAVAEPAAEPVSEPPAAAPVQAASVPAHVPSDARELDRGAAEARSSRGTLWAWTAAFVALVALGFLFDRARNPVHAPTRVEAIGAAPQQPSPAPAPAEPSGAALVAEASPPAAARAQPLVSGTEGGFEIFDRILDSTLELAPDQALLAVEAKPGSDGAQLALDGKPLGPLPVKQALSEGIHELAITRGDSVRYRFLAPRRGSTWVLREP